MPAQSPTLSPTLSAIVAGLRGSSSGMPASTLPTRSAPTSAPLVKMPPPRRAKIEISDAPKPSATSASTTTRSAARIAGEPGENGVIDRDAEQREAGHQQAGDRARLEGDVEAAGERFRRRLRGADIGAHRDVHADEAGRAGEQRAEQEAEGHPPAEQDDEQHEDDAADIGDGRVLALEIGLRAFGDGVGDFLHPLRAGVGGEQLLRGLHPVDDGQKSKDNGEKQHHGGFAPSLLTALARSIAVSDRRGKGAAPQKNAQPRTEIVDAASFGPSFARNGGFRQWRARRGGSEMTE